MQSPPDVTSLSLDQYLHHSEEELRRRDDLYWPRNSRTKATSGAGVSNPFHPSPKGSLRLDSRRYDPCTLNRITPMSQPEVEIVLTRRATQI
jgi:hypothetical protein